MRSFIYNVNFTQPTNNLNSQAFSIEANSDHSFKQVFLDSQPLEKVFAEREAERQVNQEFWRRMRAEGKNMDDVLNGNVDFEESKERIRQHQDGLVQNDLAPTRSDGNELRDDQNE